MSELRRSLEKGVHTPGPWEWTAYEALLGPDYAEVLRGYGDCHESGIHVTGANARLIAAAPDLLAASEGLREAQRNYMADRGNDEKGKLVALAAGRLDAAILKARGLTP